MSSALETSPGLILQLYEPVQEVPGAGYHPPEGGSAPSWSRCSNCREMPSDEEEDLQVLILDESSLALARYTEKIL
ncbi:hypothetical protein ACF0H5_014318 [Mactra antiquata]